MAKPIAKIIECPSGETEAQHAWRDNCWTCAPYWWLIPVCPDSGTVLKPSGWCGTHRHYCEVPDDKHAALAAQKQEAVA